MPVMRSSARSAHCVATHPSDLAVALVALDASVTLRVRRHRAASPSRSLRLPGDTPHLEHTLERGELIVDVRVPHGPYARSARYLKVRDRASYEFAVVSVAAALDITDGVIRAARLAAGALARDRGDSGVGECVGGPASWARRVGAAAASRSMAHNPCPQSFQVELLRRAIVRTLEMIAAGTEPVMSGR